MVRRPRGPAPRRQLLTEARSSALTALAFLPGCADLVLRPSLHRFLYALCSTAFAFFLFGYQVHEKAILFPLLPLLLLAGTSPYAALYSMVLALFRCA
jgi:alpha-1,3-glucosyltransferase